MFSPCCEKERKEVSDMIEKRPIRDSVLKKLKTADT